MTETVCRLLGTKLRASIRGPVWEIGDEEYDAEADFRVDGTRCAVSIQ